MDIKNLSTFREVARTLSFSRAAESLNYAQSTVTTQIQVLEQELGAPLFDRVGKRIMLTSVGERLLEYAAQLTDLEAEARMNLLNAAQEPSGVLVFDATDSVVSFLLPPIVRQYRKRYPQVDLVLKPDYRSNPAEGVKAGDVDIAITFNLPEVTEIHYELVLEAPFSFVVAPDHPLAAKSVITPSDLEEAEVFFTVPYCTYFELFDKKIERFRSNKSANFELRTSQAVKQWVMMGMGVTVISDFCCASEVERGDLVKLNWHKPDLSVPIMLAWHPDKWLSPAAQAFREIVHEMLVINEGKVEVTGQAS